MRHMHSSCRPSRRCWYADGTSGEEIFLWQLQVTPLLSTYLNSPFPTNSWHSPLGLPSTYVPGDNSWAYPHPYGVKPTPRGLACTYPSTTVNTGPPAPPPTAQLSFIQVAQGRWRGSATTCARH